MAITKSSKSSKAKRSKGGNGPRPSLVALTSATRALKKITPSSQTLQALLSSATLMHPEIYEGSRSLRGEACQKTQVQQPVIAVPHSPSPKSLELPANTSEADSDTTAHVRATISSQRHLTFPPTSNVAYRPRSSRELRCTRSSEVVLSEEHSIHGNDTSISVTHYFPRPFSEKPVHIHGSQMIHRHDIAPMIKLHILAWQDDRFVRLLRRNQICTVESQAMRSMLGERTSSALDNVLVARISNSQISRDIVGWLCCSIIRHKYHSKRVGEETGIRSLEWNLATAVRLNKYHNSGSKTSLFGDPAHWGERNDIVEVLCRGTRRSQRAEFQDQDFIAITNLVVHPEHSASEIIGKQLILQARKQAILLNMPLFVCTSGDYYARLYRDECGFAELGEHVSLRFEPEYRWKYFVYRLNTSSVDRLNAHSIEESKSNRFDFRWRPLKQAAR